VGSGTRPVQTKLKKKNNVYIWSLFQHENNSKKTKQLFGLEKTKEKNPPKQESLVFLERTVHRVGKKAENQRKSREKSKVVENQVFWLDFCAKEKDCAYTLRTRQDSNDFDV
jgi:hypothetical protein